MPIFFFKKKLVSNAGVWAGGDASQEAYASFVPNSVTKKKHEFNLIVFFFKKDVSASAHGLCGTWMGCTTWHSTR